MVLTGPRMLTQLPDRLARMATALHSMDPAPLGARISAQDEIGSMLSDLHDRAEAVGRDDLLKNLADLERSRPRPGRLAICHGDFHPFNVLSGPDGDVLLDWTAARIADPLFDVAFGKLLFAFLPIVVPRPVRPLLRAIGGFLAHRFLSRYKRYTGEKTDRDRLAWFTRLHAAKMLIELEELKRGAVTGEPHPFEAIAGRLTRLANSE